MDNSGNEIHAAGIGTGFHQDGVDITLDHTGHQRSQDLGIAVFRSVGKGRQIHMIQY